MQDTYLTRTRAIERPSRDAMLQRHPSVHRFWNENRALFQEAWAEWEATGEGGAITLDETLYDPKLRAAVKLAWDDPTKEAAVADLWEEVFPGVYKAQFFDPERLSVLRDYMERTADADIPLRPPYGISLNRGGAMLDSRSEGYLATPNFQAFYRDLMDRYMRPISRLLFPDVMGYDTQSFGFSIQWQADADTSLRAHTDASSVTLNINLNLPGEDFAGSGVRFFDRASREVAELSFAPGTALIHHGSVPHESMPITEGERSNFVLWLYGQNGQIPHPNASPKAIDPRERWTCPDVTSDGFAPF
ncbi:2OG-Fe(II) oxygenase family protein [Gymnodinialimonas sp.]